MSGEAQEVARAGLYRVLGIKGLDFISNVMRTHWMVLRRVGPVRRLYLALKTQWHLGLSKDAMVRSHQVQAVF